MPRIQKPFSYYTRVEGNCLIWTGAKSSTGYGSYRYGGKPRKAHHVAYEIANGPLPISRPGHQDFVLMHTCDNRLCVNVGHLVLGSQLDNIRDALAKKRLPQHGPVRLKRRTFDYDEAARLRKDGLTFSQIGRRLNVSASLVHRGLKRHGMIPA